MNLAGSLNALALEASQAANDTIDHMIAENKLGNVSRQAAIQQLSLTGKLDDTTIANASFGKALIEQQKIVISGIEMMNSVALRFGTTIGGLGVSAEAFLGIGQRINEVFGDAAKANTWLDSVAQMVLSPEEYKANNTYVARKQFESAATAAGVGGISLDRVKELLRRPDVTGNLFNMLGSSDPAMQAQGAAYKTVIDAAMNYNSCWPLGYCVREGSTVHVTNNPRKIQDATGGLIRRFHQTLPLARDELVGGLILGESRTRNITLSSGYLFDRQNRFTVDALDTSVSGSFDRYYRDGGTGFTKETAQTQWPNTQYDDGSGTLATAIVNRYLNLYWYLELDGNLVMVYGRDQFTSLALALEESIPATVPLRVDATAKLIARTSFQESDTSFLSVTSIFADSFSTASVSSHNNLSSLQGGTAGEYYHLTSAQATDLTDSGATTLHKHDHGGMDGLSDDDHTQYLLASDATSRAAFAANWLDLTDGGATALHTHAGTSDLSPYMSAFAAAHG